jgi:hypothetical protein
MPLLRTVATPGQSLSGRVVSRDVVGLLFAGGAACLAMVVAMESRPFHEPGAVSMARAKEFYADGADREPGERQEAARHFRASPWSQDDDFHGKEAARVRNFAKAHDVNPSSLLFALDEGMREHWPTPSNKVPDPKVKPCRPRLIY